MGRTTIGSPQLLPTEHHRQSISRATTTVYLVHLSRTTSTAPITLCAHASAMRTPEVVYDLVHAPYPFPLNSLS